MPVINPQLIKSKTSWYRGGVYCMHGRNFAVKVWGDSLVWNQFSHRVNAEVTFFICRFPILFVEVFWEQH